jgi:hypothetical protein
MVINHPLTKAAIEMYSSKVDKNTIFNADSLLSIKSLAGLKLVQTAALPLPDGVLPGAMAAVTNEVIGQKQLSKTDHA